MARYEPDVGADLGWRRFVTGTIEKVSLDGSHAEIISDDALRVVAEALRPRLLPMDS